MKPDNSLIEFSILTCLWRRKGADSSPYCISVWTGKKQVCLQVNASLYEGKQLEDWSVGWISDPTHCLGQVALCRAHLAWHCAKALTESFLFHEINFLLIKKVYLVSNFIKKRKGGDGEGESNTKKHYNEETISENLQSYKWSTYKILSKKLVYL